MLAANTPYLGAAGINRTSLGSAISVAGPYDFLPLKSARLIEIFGSAKSPAIEAITFAKAPLPPALLIHGTTDTTVYPRNSTNLVAAWRGAGALVELKLYPDVGHVDVVAAMAGLLSGRAPTRTECWPGSTRIERGRPQNRRNVDGRSGHSMSAGSIT